MNATTVIKWVETAIVQLKQGGLVIVVDDDHREAEGDMVGLAQYATPETVNTMVTKARGLLCVPMTAEIAHHLQLNQMTANETEPFQTAFTVSVDATTTTTGISAFERADTIRQLAKATAQPDDFYRPGHVFPLVAVAHGVLARDGHTEAAVDLARLAGATPVAYICEILKKDGHMARRHNLKPLAEGMQLPYLSIQDLKQYRLMKDIDVMMAGPTVDLPTKYGHFRLQAFTTHDDNEPALLISKGQLDAATPLLLRVHSECLTGDVFGSLRCDCGEQLAQALTQIEAAGSGAVIYLRQEGRGIGLANKLKAYQLQEQGFDTVEANVHLGFQPDERDYGLVATILRRVGVQSVQLMTNNPDKISQLERLGVTVTQRVPLEMTPHDEDRAYLTTKKHKFNHLLREVQ